MRALDWLLPRRCLVCREAGEDVCEGCSAALPRIGPTICGRCGKPTQWPVARCEECAGRRLAFVSARAAVIYDDAVRAIVSAWKERGLRGIAVLAAELVVDVVARPAVGAVAWVPADGDRSLERGHHPAERLAQELASRWRLEPLPLVARARQTRRQTGMTLVARRRNVAGAFRPLGRSPPRVALVDDVYTSGATATAAASALRAGGARRVEVVTFARAVRG
jgi:predicted amidophosphoribosyltransferase